MAKKFFYNRVYNTKRTIINIVIIGICIIGIIVCFIITSNFQGEDHTTPEKTLNIKNEVTIEINQTYSKEIFFSKIENVDLNEIKVSYDNNYNIAKVGKYKVTLNINGKNYYSTLKVVDTNKPELKTKEVTIKENESYVAKDFVINCTDNSNEQCNISFYTEGVDEEGNKIDYSKYKDAGTYTVKIAASDASGNQSVEEESLIIKKSNGTIIPSTKTCKYGDDTYDTDNNIIAISVATDHCAVNKDLWNDQSMTKDINKIMETESIRIQKDIYTLNIKGIPALVRNIFAVVNSSNIGFVGYELNMVVTITNNGKSEVVADYKLDSKGKRVFSINKYNLAS